MRPWLLLVRAEAGLAPAPRKNIRHYTEVCSFGPCLLIAGAAFFLAPPSQLVRGVGHWAPHRPSLPHLTLHVPGGAWAVWVVHWCVVWAGRYGGKSGLTSHRGQPPAMYFWVLCVCGRNQWGHFRAPHAAQERNVLARGVVPSLHATCRSCNSVGRVEGNGGRPRIA